MLIKRYLDAPAYADRVAPFLLQREAEHCLPLGILARLLRGETRNPRPPYLSLVADDAGHVVLVAMATPPNNLILSHPAALSDAELDEALSLVAVDVRDAALDLPGVIGPDPQVDRYVARWQALTGQRARVNLHERIYRLEHVIPARTVAGHMRRIEEADRSILREWLRAFSVEALGDPDEFAPDAEIDWRMRTASSGMVLWQDGASPVSVAGYGNPTLHGIRVGPVYTPPEQRGHGYASALTAALSQFLLDAGRQFVFLFTDLANPTSNHIYQAIGYQPISDATEYQFDPRGRS